MPFLTALLLCIALATLPGLALARATEPARAWTQATLGSLGVLALGVLALGVSDKRLRMQFVCGANRTTAKT